MADAVSARHRMHIKRCLDPQCVLESDQPGEDCRNLDYLINLIEEQALHLKAGELADMHMDAVLTHGAGVGQGLALGIKTIEPYKRGDGDSLIRRSDGTPAPRFPGSSW